MVVTPLRASLQVIALWLALFSSSDPKAFWLHCFELWALEVIVPAEGPSQIAG